MDGMGQLNILDWYWDLPPVTRSMFTASFALTAACALDFITPFTLYYNASLIWTRGEVWRLLTNFLFYGQFGIDYVFHMYFCEGAPAARCSSAEHAALCRRASLAVVRFSSVLESSSFRRAMAEHLWFLFLGGSFFMAVAPWVKMHFFGSALTFMMVYVWARRNPHERMALLGVVHFDAPWLPWVYLGLSLLMGQTVVVDLLGIAAGHVYFYCQDVLPAVCQARGWAPHRLLGAPSLFKYALGELREQQPPVAIAAAAPARAQ